MTRSRIGRWTIFLAAIALTLFAATEMFAKKNKNKDPARRLYATRCAGACHRLYKPHEFTGEQWRKIVDEMSGRAKLTEAEARTIKTYLMQSSAAKKQPSKRPGSDAAPAGEDPSPRVSFKTATF